MRSNYYYSDRGIKLFLKDADGKMYFRAIRNPDLLDRNSREERCITYDTSDVMNLPNDTVLVLYDMQEGILLFQEKWRLYFIDPVNILIDKRNITLQVPYNTFKSIGGGYSWMDVHATNVTWDSIKDNISAEPVPDLISDQISLYNHAIKEKKSS